MKKICIFAIILLSGCTKQKPEPLLDPVPAPIPSMQQSSQINWGIAAGGVLTHMNQNELDTYFSKLTDLGVTWVRFDFPWEDVQSNDSKHYDWSNIDRVVLTANRYKLKILGTIAYAPNWAQNSLCRGNYTCSPADPKAFGTFAGLVAARYADQGVHTWEIWNEPNIIRFWQPAPQVTDYVTLLRLAYNQIKKNDSQAVVMTGGLSPAADSEGNIAPITFTQALYRQDPTKDFDAIALHPYSSPVEASYQINWNSWQQMSSIRQIMVDHQDANKMIWITEYGAPTGGPGKETTLNNLNYKFGTDYMSEDAQSALMTDALTELLKIRSYTKSFFWYSLIDLSNDKSDPENFYGLLRYDESKKPAFTIYQRYIK